MTPAAPSCFSKRERQKFGLFANVEPASRAWVAVKSAPVWFEWEHLPTSRRYAIVACSSENASSFCVTTTPPSSPKLAPLTSPHSRAASRSPVVAARSSIAAHRSIGGSFHRVPKVDAGTTVDAGTILAAEVRR